ncbi:MAG TPA: hypothetical protein VGL59_18755 [Polyangia bacterium]
MKELTAGAFALLATAVLLVDCQGTPIDPIRSRVGTGGAMNNGGTGGDNSGGSGGASWEGCAMAAQVFSEHACTTICHVAAAAPAFAGFDMTTSGWEKRLVGAASPATAPSSSMCKGMGRIYLNRTLPATGLFLDKVKPNPPCGVQMPQALAPLSSSEVDCIQRWANNVVADAISTGAGGSTGSGGAFGTGGSSASDAGVDSPSDADTTPEAKCLTTGGNGQSNLCCNATSDFPDLCLVGACGCAPQNSHSVQICNCPVGTCYSPGRGCIGSDCMLGQDQTCNDNPVVSSYQGRCMAGPGGTRCVCNPPFTLNPNNGHCG